mmetsp:Transcript_49651/g.106398  ORF Transcript_49651/g.106398 Transcript_49651/m.106398 type:complete len:275 (-) Transcript_49651:214-1038(-)
MSEGRSHEIVYSSCKVSWPRGGSLLVALMACSMPESTFSDAAGLAPPPRGGGLRERLSRWPPSLVLDRVRPPSGAPGAGPFPNPGRPGTTTGGTTTGGPAGFWTRGAGMARPRPPPLEVAPPPLHRSYQCGGPSALSVMATDAAQPEYHSSRLCSWTYLFMSSSAGTKHSILPVTFTICCAMWFSFSMDTMAPLDRRMPWTFWPPGPMMPAAIFVATAMRKMYSHCPAPLPLMQRLVSSVAPRPLPPVRSCSLQTGSMPINFLSTGNAPSGPPL